MKHLRDHKPENGGFPCPRCGQKATLLRSYLYGATVSRWRRHKCACGYFFSTCQKFAVAPKGLWNKLNSGAAA